MLEEEEDDEEDDDDEDAAAGAACVDEGEVTDKQCIMAVGTPPTVWPWKDGLCDDDDDDADSDDEDDDDDDVDDDDEGVRCSEAEGDA